MAKLIKKWVALFLFSSVLITSCSYWLPNKGTIILDMRDKLKPRITGKNLSKYYKLGDSEQELQIFERLCREEIRSSQLDGSEEIVFENIRHGIHGQVEFKKCNDQVTRIYQY